MTKPKKYNDHYDFMLQIQKFPKGGLAKYCVQLRKWAGIGLVMQTAETVYLDTLADVDEYINRKTKEMEAQ